MHNAPSPETVDQIRQELCHLFEPMMSKWHQKCSLVAGYWTINWENLGTRFSSCCGQVTTKWLNSQWNLLISRQNIVYKHGRNSSYPTQPHSIIAKSLEYIVWHRVAIWLLIVWNRVAKCSWISNNIGLAYWYTSESLIYNKPLNNEVLKQKTMFFSPLIVKYTEKILLWANILCQSLGPSIYWGFTVLMLAWLRGPYGTHPPKLSVIDSRTKALPSVQHLYAQ